MPREGAGWQRLSGMFALAMILAGGLWLIVTEAPYGTLHGRLVVEAGGGLPPDMEVIVWPKPRDPAVTLAGLPVPPPDSPITLRCDRHGAFGGRLAAGKYSVTAETRTLQGKAEFTVAEGQQARLELPLKLRPSELEVIIHQHVTPTGEPTEIAVKGHVKDAALTVRLYRVDLRKLSLEQRGNLRRLADPQFTYRTRVRPGGNPEMLLAGEKTETITTRDAEGLFYQRVKMEIPAPGVYLATVDADGLQELGWVMQSDIALLTKSDRQQMVAQVCGLRDGRPVPGAQVEVFRDKTPVFNGETDGDGLLPIPLPSTTEEAGATVIATSAGSEAFVTPYLEATEAPPLQVYFVTDRPIYRPGHKVQFKLLARRPDGANYKVPAGEEVRVQMRDPNETLLLDQRLRLNEWGSCAGAFDLSEEAATGEYTLECVTPDHELTHYFTVAAYRKPEYEVKVTPERERVVQGDTITATVQANYYFGTPVAGAKVRYNVYSSPYWHWEPSDEEAADAGFYGEEGFADDVDAGGEMVAHGTTVTDASGRARISLPTKRGADDEQDRQFALEATVTDVSGRSVTEEAKVVVLRGEVLVTLDPASYITAPGQPVQVAVRVQDAEKKTPVVGAALTVGWERQEWEKDKPRGRGRPQARDPHFEQITTGANGGAFTVAPDRAGDYRIVAKVTDRRGNTIAESASLYCTAEDVPIESGLREGLQVTLDKRVYRPGEQAKALVFSAEPVETALLTVEGEKLHEWRVISLRKGSTLVELPVKPEYLPNVYVVVSSIYKQDLHEAQKRLNVSPREHALQVAVTPDKTEYQPGETATCQVQVQDALGAPARAEVALGVVDEAIYALAEDQTQDPLQFFYSERVNRVDTAYSFPSVYLSADKASKAAELRKNFPDTAYWNPSVVTDERGMATVSFPVPDTLTKWRMTARAATMATAVGQRVGAFTCRKPFFVRLETPRCVTEGDRFEAAVIVHNETGTPQEAALRFVALGGKVEGSPDRRVRVDNTPARVTWWLTAEPGTRLKLAVTAAAGQYTDGVELRLPTNVNGRTVRSQAAGVAEAGTDSAGRVELQAGNVARKLEMRLSNSLPATAYGGLDYLAAYPYGCVEQTMSCFLPDVILYDTVKSMGRPNPKLARKLPAMVRDSLTRLYSMQHGDGGWGWWRYDEPDVWMTAYVLYGMGLAKQAGFDVNQHVYERGLDTLGTYVEEMKHLKADALALAALALAQGGRKDKAETALSQSGRAPGYGPIAMALDVRALHAMGQDERARWLLEQLITMAQTTAGGMAWPTAAAEADWKPFTSATAEALVAMLEVNPRDERAAQCVRWLVGQRRGQGWVTTLDTASAVTALCRYLKQHPPATGPVQAEVAVNGRVVQTVELGAATTEQPEAAVVLQPADIAAGANEVRVRTKGGGEVWWTAELRQTETAKATAAGWKPCGPEVRCALPGTATASIVSTYHRYGLQRDWLHGGSVMAARARAESRFRVGEVIEGQVVVKTTRPLDYAMIEVPLPAGCEPLTRGELAADDWDMPYDDSDVRDDRVCFFVRRLEGERKITYRVRALTAGRFHVPPAQVSGMYQPEVAGWTAGAAVEIR